MYVRWAAYLPSPRVACICTLGISNSTTDTTRCECTPTEGNRQSAEIRSPYRTLRESKLACSAAKSSDFPCTRSTEGYWCTYQSCQLHSISQVISSALSEEVPVGGLARIVCQSVWPEDARWWHPAGHFLFLKSKLTRIAAL